MNYKFDLSTKLRLENSALGTYEVAPDSASVTIGKNITRDKFLGAVLTVSLEGSITSHVIVTVQELKDVTGQTTSMTLACGNNVTFTYNPETGVLSMNMPSGG